MSWFCYAWRNLWRNKRRTAITLAAICLNTALLIDSYALMDGLLAHTVKNATGLLTGQVQIHAPGYLEDRSLYKTVRDWRAIVEACRREGIGAAPRVYGYGLLAHGRKSAGALFWGVSPWMEREYFTLAGHMKTGEYLTDTAEQKVVLGKKLARSLDVGVGDELVAVVQAADGSLGNELFTVGAIAKAVGEEVDRGGVIMHREDLRQLFVLGESAHEIALNSSRTSDLAVLKNFALQAAGWENEVKTWRELLPLLADMTNMSEVSMAIFASIFFLAAGFSVLNTMLMSTYERMQEFGVMKALGAGPWAIVAEVGAESLLLSWTATLAGAVLGLGGAYYLQTMGIDMRAFSAPDVAISFGGVAFDPVWRAVISVRAVVLPVIVMWLVCWLASLYPAAAAARYDPVKALRHV